MVIDMQSLFTCSNQHAVCSHAWCAQITMTESTITHLYDCAEALSLLFRVVDMQLLCTCSNQHASIRAPGHRCDQRLMTEVRSDRCKAAAQGPCIQLALLRNHCTKVVDRWRPAELHTQKECSSSVQRQASSGDQQKCTHKQNAQTLYKGSWPTFH